MRVLIVDDDAVPAMGGMGPGAMNGMNPMGAHVPMNGALLAGIDLRQRVFEACGKAFGCSRCRRRKRSRRRGRIGTLKRLIAFENLCAQREHAVDAPTAADRIDAHADTARPLPLAMSSPCSRALARR